MAEKALQAAEKIFSAVRDFYQQSCLDLSAWIHYPLQNILFNGPADSF
jgi:hypothetical protein